MADALAKCDQTLQGCAEYAAKLEGAYKFQNDTLMRVIDERNAAQKQVMEDNTRMPWYFWLVMGAASAFVVKEIK